MATIMEKDVLLEYSSIAYLTASKIINKEEEILTTIGKLREDILMTSPENIDYEFMISIIKDIRLKLTSITRSSLPNISNKESYSIINFQENATNTSMDKNEVEITPELLKEVWDKEILKYNQFASPNQKSPQGFVLGGQPGAGKASLTARAKTKLNRNILEINGDNYRKYHPDFKILQEKYAEEAPKYTGEFSGTMTEAILQKALNDKYNIIIEGTFRTAETPIKTLQKLKENNYTTTVLIQTCNKSISQASYQERYQKMLQIIPEEARATPQKSHDYVIDNLANNIKEVEKSKLADHIEIYTRIPNQNNSQNFNYLEVFNSKNNKSIDINEINKYIKGTD